MLGQLGQLTSLLKNAGKIKDTMQQVQVRLAAARYVGVAGGGQVQATADGRGELVAIKIDVTLINSGDVEMIEELVCAAARQATQISRDGLQKEMSAVTGGLNLPGMDELFGGGPPR